MSTSDEDNFKALLFHLEPLLKFAGLTHHGHFHLNTRLIILLVLFFFDFLLEIWTDFWLEYDEDLFLTLGNKSAYVQRAQYGYFAWCTVILKITTMAFLVHHGTSDYGWIDHVARLYGKLVNMNPQMRIRSNEHLGKKSLVFVFIHWGLTCLPCMMLIVMFHWNFVVLRHLVGQCLNEAVIAVHAFLQSYYLGMFYLNGSICADLVNNFSKHLDRVERKQQFDEIISSQSYLFVSFSLMAEMITTINRYLMSLYLLYVVNLSCLVPILLFNILYSGMDLATKSMLTLVFLNFGMTICFLSTVLGLVEKNLEAGVHKLFHFVVLGNKRDNFEDKKYKMYNLLKCCDEKMMSASFLGYHINVTSTITLFTFYVTFFSFLLSNRKSLEA